MAHPTVLDPRQKHAGMTDETKTLDPCYKRAGMTVRVW